MYAVGGFEQGDAPHRLNSRWGRYDAPQPQARNCPERPLIIPCVCQAKSGEEAGTEDLPQEA